jgi:hypothetical protein
MINLIETSFVRVCFQNIYIMNIYYMSNLMVTTLYRKMVVTFHVCN